MDIRDIELTYSQLGAVLRVGGWATFLGSYTLGVLPTVSQGII